MSQEVPAPAHHLWHGLWGWGSGSYPTAKKSEDVGVSGQGLRRRNLSKHISITQICKLLKTGKPEN